MSRETGDLFIIERKFVSTEVKLSVHGGTIPCLLRYGVYLPTALASPSCPDTNEHAPQVCTLSS